MKLYELMTNSMRKDIQSMLNKIMLDTSMREMNQILKQVKNKLEAYADEIMGCYD